MWLGEADLFPFMRVASLACTATVFLSVICKAEKVLCLAEISWSKVALETRSGEIPEIWGQSDLRLV